MELRKVFAKEFADIAFFIQFFAAYGKSFKSL